MALTYTVAIPPLQNMLMNSALVAVTTAIPLITVDPLLLAHPLASVTTKVYVPLTKAEILAVVAPLDHK